MITKYNTTYAPCHEISPIFQKVSQVEVSIKNMLKKE